MSRRELLDRVKKLIKKQRRKRDEVLELKTEDKLLASKEEELLAELNEEFGIRDLDELESLFKEKEKALLKYTAFEEDEEDEDDDL